MTFQKEIKKFVFDNDITIDKAEYMLRFFEDNISEGYTIFGFTENLNFNELKRKVEIALKVISLNPPLNDINCKSWKNFFYLLELLLDFHEFTGWTKDEFQIDFITLTLQAIIEYQKTIN
ncbi:hypothetical protein [Thomasclavelia cocleata]|uniref:hypothetical protein n=1 Tax=Thomasclavelia cocleata TaxID=69824 RepID=UPI0025582F0A|nr:hypothetical protein [Thomasclavelia cocleata]